MTLLKRLLLHPAGYVLWAVLVTTALAITYPIDPYVFGIGAMLLACISTVVATTGISVLVFTKSPSTPARVTISISLVMTAAALAWAFVTLRSFQWN